MFITFISDLAFYISCLLVLFEQVALHLIIYTQTCHSGNVIPICIFLFLEFVNSHANRLVG